jgi:prevent-host-death family protein
MNIEVGSYEAKTKLPELLRGVQSGKRYTITLRGEAVADLVPPQGTRRADVGHAAGKHAGVHAAAYTGARPRSEGPY